MIKVKISGVGAAARVVDRFRRSLTGHLGLREALAGTMIAHNKGTPIPERSGRLAASLRQLGHPEQVSELTSTGGGRAFEFRFGTSVPYAKYQQHRIRRIAAKRLAAAYEKFLEGK